MHSLRIVAASAVLLIGIGAAGAQTATDSTPGKPISLTPAVQPAKGKAKLHTKPAPKVARKSHRKAHHTVAAAKPEEPRAKVAKAADTAPAAIAWPPLPEAPASAADVSASTPVSAFPAAPAAQPHLSEMVVDGQTVHIASPDDVNELDLAATKSSDGAAAAVKTEVAEPTTSAPAPVKPAVASVTEAAAKKNESPISKTSWYLETFAALGGAVAAGSIAWFLIGAPQRTYN
jgi:hypothetical protein